VKLGPPKLIAIKGERLRTSNARMRSASSKRPGCVRKRPMNVHEVQARDAREPELVHAREGRDARKTVAFRLAHER